MALFPQWGHGSLSVGFVLNGVQMQHPTEHLQGCSLSSTIGAQKVRHVLERDLHHGRAKGLKIAHLQTAQLPFWFIFEFTSTESEQARRINSWGRFAWPGGVAQQREHTSGLSSRLSGASILLAMTIGGFNFDGMERDGWFQIAAEESTR